MLFEIWSFFIQRFGLNMLALVALQRSRHHHPPIPVQGRAGVVGAVRRRAPIRGDHGHGRGLHHQFEPLFSWISSSTLSTSSCGSRSWITSVSWTKWLEYAKCATSRSTRSSTLFLAEATWRWTSKSSCCWMFGGTIPWFRALPTSARTSNFPFMTRSCFGTIWMSGEYSYCSRTTEEWRGRTSSTKRVFRGRT